MAEKTYTTNPFKGKKTLKRLKNVVRNAPVVGTLIDIADIGKSLITGNYSQAGDGTATALWLAGGYLATGTTLNFDGTSFSAQGALSSPSQYATGAGYGTQTSAIVAGGDPNTDTQGEQYNGTSWVTAPSLSQGRKYGLGASRSSGSQTGFICGGATPPNPNTNATEEFTPETSALNIQNITDS